MRRLRSRDDLDLIGDIFTEDILLSHFPRLYDLLARPSHAPWTQTLLQPHQPQYLEGHLSGAAHWPLEGVVTVSMPPLKSPSRRGGSVVIRQDKRFHPKSQRQGLAGRAGRSVGGGGGWGAAGSRLGRLPHSPSWPRRHGPMDALCGSKFWVRRCPGTEGAHGQAPARALGAGGGGRRCDAGRRSGHSRPEPGSWGPPGPVLPSPTQKEPGKTRHESEDAPT